MNKPLVYTTLLAATMLTGVVAAGNQTAPVGSNTISQMQPAPSMSPSPEPSPSSTPS
ncbi:MAG TPA: hypothetical protein VHR97_08375 [Candidatus Baltobacteraceae bacterium]|jgi:hypothetical protein|nr:hypothetical protein [Candidatus Baltobacteraceae bacterium]